MPYVCEGTLVKTNTNREGEVISVDRVNKIVIVTTGTGVFSENLNDITVISYDGVM